MSMAKTGMKFSQLVMDRTEYTYHFTCGDNVVDAGPPGADAVVLGHLFGHGAAHAAVVHRRVDRVPELGKVKQGCHI